MSSKLIERLAKSATAGTGNGGGGEEEAASITDVW
jgi:hypothetical protein